MMKMIKGLKQSKIDLINDKSKSVGEVANNIGLSTSWVYFLRGKYAKNPNKKP